MAGDEVPRLLPSPAMTSTTITIKTDDGNCRASTYRPATAKGPLPAVLMYMDGIGYRPALFEMAQHLADHGYFVLLPDLFYRAGAYEAPDPKELFTNPELQKTWFSKYFSVATQPNIMRDTRAFLEYFSAQPDVAATKVGTVGYCMGGGFSLGAAGFYPDRVAAAASYHGGNLATDAPESVHLLAPKMRAKVYVGGATEDTHFPDAQKQRLEQALTAANVNHTVETYAARHGWVPRDTPVHDDAGTAKHWQTLFALFDSTLR